MSASTTHCVSALVMTSATRRNASCALRPGRKPYEQSQNSGSQMACRRRLSRSCTNRSSKLGTLQRTVASIPLGNVAAPHRLRPVAHSAYPRRQVVQLRVQVLSVVVFSYPIDSGRLVSFLSLEAFAQALGVEQQPHQRIEPLSQLLARHQCETLKFGCHGQNPLGVGPCVAFALSQTATPLLDPHYRASSLVWMAPTSTHHRPCPRFLHLFTGARLRRTDTWISLVTTCSPCQARYGLGPRGVSVPLAIAQHGLLPAGGTNPSALPTVLYGAQHLQGRLHPLPLHLACFRAYASTCPLPSTPQGSILGSRRTITQAGFPPARTRGLARPHCPRNWAKGAGSAKW